MTETTGYAQLIEPTEDTTGTRKTKPRSAQAGASAQASYLELPAALRKVISAHALAVAEGVATGLREQLQTLAFNDAVTTDKRLQSRVRTAVAQYAAKHGVTEAQAAPVVLAEIRKEF